MEGKGRGMTVWLEGQVSQAMVDWMSRLCGYRAWTAVADGEQGRGVQSDVVKDCDTRDTTVPASSDGGAGEGEMSDDLRFMMGRGRVVEGCGVRGEHKCRDERVQSVLTLARARCFHNADEHGGRG